MGEWKQEGMTNLMFRYASEGFLTLPEALQRLRQDAYVRTVQETLARYCEIDRSDTAALRKRVTALYMESDPMARKDSVERRVRSWFNDRIQLISKKNALQLAFALQLSVEDAQEMLWRLSGEKLHWRDPEDIVWLFALDRELSYPSACALQERMAPFYTLPENARDDTDTMTESVRKTVQQLQTKNELQAYLAEAAPHLGKFHNTAYSLYMDFMELLKEAPTEDLLADSESMQVSEIVTTYLYNNLIPRLGKQKGKKDSQEKVLRDAISRDITLNWPDEFTLSRMTNRKTDVTRKVLILLFLACDGGESEYGDYNDVKPEELFDDTCSRLDTMLADCGYEKLDSRIPFDWMALYCLAVDDVLCIDANIQKFLTEIFQVPQESDPEEEE